MHTQNYGKQSDDILYSHNHTADSVIQELSL